MILPKIIEVIDKYHINRADGMTTEPASDYAVEDDNQATSPRDDIQILSSQIPYQELLLLSPLEIAKNEAIFDPSPVGETIFRTWSTMTSSYDHLPYFMNIFGPNETIVITLKAHEAKHISFTDRMTNLLGLNTQFYYKRMNGKIVTIEPQILLHQNATAYDIFRSLVMIHHIKYHMNIMINSYDQVSSDGNKSLGLIELTKLVQESYHYQRDHIESILNVIKLCGWDVSSFMYGSIRARVEWPVV
jgi:hypothetical protein